MAASTTVGTPTAITGTPSVSRSNAQRRLPTPEPGQMPVSDSCTALHSRSRRRAARASTAMTMAGSTRWTSPATASADSTPVVPSTPVRITATERKPENCRGMERSRCRVTSTLSAARGPTASGVMAGLPNPTTSAGPSAGSRARSSVPTARTARSKKSGRRWKKEARSMWK